MAGKVVPATWHACKSPACPRGIEKPIKVTGTATGVPLHPPGRLQPAARSQAAAQFHAQSHQADGGRRDLRGVLVQ
eukprot:1797833-Prymnesium_polylepis.1